MLVNIDRETIDQANELVEGGELSKFLLAHTTDYLTAAFILNAVITAIDDAYEKLNAKD